MEDEKIIALFWSRSEQAIEETAAKYGRLCRKIAGNILENEQDTEECLNDTYLGVWNSIPPARPAVLRAYVCRIARNLAVKKFRSNTAAKRDSRSDCLLEELEEGRGTDRKEGAVRISGGVPGYPGKTGKDNFSQTVLGRAGFE